MQCYERFPKLVLESDNLKCKFSYLLVTWVLEKIATRRLFSIKYYINAEIHSKLFVLISKFVNTSLNFKIKTTTQLGG